MLVQRQMGLNTPRAQERRVTCSMPGTENDLFVGLTRGTCQRMTFIMGRSADSRRAYSVLDLKGVLVSTTQ
jgi:hypothetical protein